MMMVRRMQKDMQELLLGRRFVLFFVDPVILSSTLKIVTNVTKKFLAHDGRAIQRRKAGGGNDKGKG